MPASPRWQVIAVVIYAFLFLVPLFWLTLRAAGGDASFAVGQFVGRALLPAIVVAIYFRRRPVTRARVYFWLVTWAILADITGIASQRPPISAADVPQIMLEAAGAVPLPARDSDERAAIRQVYRNILDRSRRYQQEMKQFELTLAQLNTAASFRDSERVLTALKAMRALETENAKNISLALAEFEAAIGGFDWPEPHKEAMLRGVRMGMSKSADLRQRALAAELEWVDRTIELYEYVHDHSGRLRFSGDTIRTPDPAVHKQLRQLSEAAEAARLTAVATHADYERQRQVNQRGMGLSDEQLGLQPATPAGE